MAEKPVNIDEYAAAVEVIRRYRHQNRSWTLEIIAAEVIKGLAERQTIWIGERKAIPATEALLSAVEDLKEQK